MAASGCLRLYGSRKPCLCCLKVQLPPQATSQSFRDEGSYSKAVDANMSVLRSRMEQVKMRERLSACYKLGNGWNYRSGYDDVRWKYSMFMMSIELATVVCTSIGLVFLTGSLSIFLVSLIFSS